EGVGRPRCVVGGGCVRGGVWGGFFAARVGNVGRNRNGCDRRGFANGPGTGGGTIVRVRRAEAAAPTGVDPTGAVDAPAGGGPPRHRWGPRRVRPSPASSEPRPQPPSRCCTAPATGS